eukprot:5702222-Pleurochrysis_carterae.AAC.2
MVPMTSHWPRRCHPFLAAPVRPECRMAGSALEGHGLGQRCTARAHALVTGQSETQTRDGRPNSNNVLQRDCTFELFLAKA